MKFRCIIWSCVTCVCLLYRQRFFWVSKALRQLWLTINYVMSPDLSSASGSHWLSQGAPQVAAKASSISPAFYVTALHYNAFSPSACHICALASTWMNEQCIIEKCFQFSLPIIPVVGLGSMLVAGQCLWWGFAMDVWHAECRGWQPVITTWKPAALPASYWLVSVR